MSRRYPGGFLTVSYNGFSVPNAPIIGTASNANAQSLVTFTPPSNVGGGAITSYQAIATNIANGSRILATGSSSPILVTGLTNYVTYSIVVAATNTFGTGPVSAGATAQPYLPNPPTSVEYLVVGGGGGGGQNGGGGGGGVRTGSVAVPAGTALNVTVGAGGAGGFSSYAGGKSPFIQNQATNGGSSAFHNIGSTGGGRGGVYPYTGTTLGPGSADILRGNSGGSGGGAGGYYSYFVQPVGKTPGFTVIVNQGGSGTGGQGNSGGNGTITGSFAGRTVIGGGGGGAGGVGASANGNNPGFTSAGGNGVASSITLSSVTYGGGGGGGLGNAFGSAYQVPLANSGPGGSGGGGRGTYFIPGFQVGKTFTQPQYLNGEAGGGGLGGGGGGGYQANINGNFTGRQGGPGGSGRVVIRYPDTFDAPVAVSGASVTVSGGYRIYTWFGSGNITF